MPGTRHKTMGNSSTSTKDCHCILLQRPMQDMHRLYLYILDRLEVHPHHLACHHCRDQCLRCHRYHHDQCRSILLDLLERHQLCSACHRHRYLCQSCPQFHPCQHQPTPPHHWETRLYRPSPHRHRYLSVKRHWEHTNADGVNSGEVPRHILHMNLGKHQAARRMHILLGGRCSASQNATLQSFVLP